MSKELMEFSGQIDELFDQVSVEADDFWEQLTQLFI